MANGVEKFPGFLHRHPLLVEDQVGQVAAADRRQQHQQEWQRWDQTCLRGKMVMYTFQLMNSLLNVKNSSSKNNCLKIWRLWLRDGKHYYWSKSNETNLMFWGQTYSILNNLTYGKSNVLFGGETLHFWSYHNWVSDELPSVIILLSLHMWRKFNLAKWVPKKIWITFLQLLYNPSMDCHIASLYLLCVHQKINSPVRLT